jgi:hypothetical protein
MFFNGKAKIAMLLLAAVLVAGCTGDGGITPTGGGYGLEIIELSADPTSAYSTQSAKITTTVENQGDAVIAASKSALYLFGPLTEWGSPTAAQPIEKQMRPDDPTRNITADKYTKRWSLTAPTLPRGQTRTDDFIVRAYYDYNTTSRGAVWAYSQSEATAAQEAGKTLQSSMFTNTRGPLSIAISVSPDPPIVTESERTFTITIDITNLGGGTAYKQTAIDYSSDFNIDETTELNKFGYTITLPSGKLEAVSGSCDLTNDDEELIGGTSTIMCDVKYTPGIEALMSMPIEVALNYGYYSDQTVSLTAIGR